MKRVVFAERHGRLVRILFSGSFLSGSFFLEVFPGFIGGGLIFFGIILCSLHKKEKVGYPKREIVIFLVKNIMLPLQFTVLTQKRRCAIVTASLVEIFRILCLGAGRMEA